MTTSMIVIALFGALSLASAVAAGVAIHLSLKTYIELRAQQMSTHTIIPAGQPNTFEALEKAMKDINPLDQRDLNDDLFRAGMQDPDELV